MKTEPAQVIAGRASGVEQAVYVSAFRFIDIMMHNCTPAIMFDCNEFTRGIVSWAILGRCCVLAHRTVPLSRYICHDWIN